MKSFYELFGKNLGSIGIFTNSLNNSTCGNHLGVIDDFHFDDGNYLGGIEIFHDNYDDVYALKVTIKLQNFATLILVENHLGGINIFQIDLTNINPLLVVQKTKMMNPRKEEYVDLDAAWKKSKGYVLPQAFPILTNQQFTRTIEG